MAASFGQSLAGLDEHDARKDKEHDGFGESCKTLELAVTVVVVTIRRFVGSADREIGHDSGSRIDEGVARL